MLYADRCIGQNSRLLIWKIDESFSQLKDEVQLTEKNHKRLEGMKSESHQCGFLAVRKLFQVAGYTDADVFYDETGKPNLSDGRHISISHSHGFSTILLSDHSVGLDLELMREKIIRIADKFTSDQETAYMDPSHPDYIAKLTVLWGIKEAIFKIRNEIGISFKDHISACDFTLESSSTLATLHFNNTIRDFGIRFMKVSDYMLVYAYEKHLEDAL
jgi:4'-phosphopantetheinyl transferase